MLGIKKFFRYLSKNTDTCVCNHEIAPYLLFNSKKISHRYPVIFLHGVLGNKKNWRTVARELNEKFGFLSYTIDTRHHGDWPSSQPFDYFSLAQDVKNFIDHHNASPIHLVGHSMGGKTAMAFSQLFPDKTQTLTIVDIAPITVRQVQPSSKKGPLIRSYITAMSSMDFTKITNKNAARAYLLEKLQNRDLVEFLLMNLTEGPDGFLRWSFDIKSFLLSFDSLIEFPNFNPNFHGPTLFVVGEKSEKEDFHSIKNLYPQTEIKMVGDVGHLIHMEAPQIFLNILSNFLDSYDPHIK